MKKNKYHWEHSKRAINELKNTDYSKCTPESFMAQIRRIQRQAFEQEFGFLKKYGVKFRDGKAK